MDNQDTALPADRALVSDQAAARLAPTGFDPSRYEGKPRHLPKAKRRLLRALVDAVEERMSLMSERERTDLLRACLEVSPINCAWDEYAMARLVWPSLSHNAQAIEVRRAETQGSVHESAVSEGDAP